MKSFETEIKKYTAKVSLKASERRELRDRVVSYMEYHPLKKADIVSVESRSAFPDAIVSEPFMRLTFSSRFVRIASGVFVVMLAVTSFAAERAVPGEVLYLVKTGVNEPIQGTLVNSPYEKIEFETKLMERRIAEARELADEGKLTEKVQTKIADTVKGHAVAVQNEIAELREQDAEGAAIAGIGFTASLEVQTAVLSGNESTTSAAQVDSILTVVNDVREEVASNQETEKPSFEGLMARIESETTRAYELFASVKSAATTTEVTDIERRLSDIERLITEAKEKQRTDSDVAASELATTLGLIQKLIVFMTDITVRETVQLETIVPVVLSDAERTDLAKEKLRILNGSVHDIEQRILIEPELETEKITEALARIAELIRIGETSLEVGDIDNTERSFAEAGALVEDVSTLTQLTETPTQPHEPTDEAAVEQEDGEATTTPPGVDADIVPEF